MPGTPLITRILWAVLYGIVVFVVVLIIAAILSAVGLSQVGAVLNRFAAVLGLLAGLVTFFTGHRGV
jgi:hypothetical protein